MRKRDRDSPRPSRGGRVATGEKEKEWEGEVRRREKRGEKQNVVNLAQSPLAIRQLSEPQVSRHLADSFHTLIIIVTSVHTRPASRSLCCYNTAKSVRKKATRFANVLRCANARAKRATRLNVTIQI